MELTAASLQQVEFGAKVRGYDPAEVDNFINDVIEAGEELYERLRRATEKAAHAEQQLAAVAANPPPEPAAPAPSQAPGGDLGRIWERAVAAAESAIDEARQEAQRILEEATHSSDETVSGARREAARISEEAEGQLRAQITQLESAREQLKGDVDGLAAYLDEEKGRLRVTIANALGALDDYGSGPAAPPETNDVHVPAQSPSAHSNDFNRESGRQFEQQRHAQPQNQNQSFARQAPTESPWVADQPVEPTPQRASQADDKPQEDDGDPFLAELRRAVRDDGPLGPRDDEEAENDDDAIDRLYASDDDDSSFFKRKK